LFSRTGFEEDKNFHVVLNSVIAGRYHVTEYLGSAAFSKAIQAHDLHTGMDVCVKIIKNNKDFFDQSLDEIKLLKYVNKHDPADKYHILRLYDYFYYRVSSLFFCSICLFINGFPLFLLFLLNSFAFLPKVSLSKIFVLFALQELLNYFHVTVVVGWNIWTFIYHDSIREYCYVLKFVNITG